MKPISPNLCRLTALCLLLLLKESEAEEVVAVHATEISTGNSVIALVLLPNNAFTTPISVSDNPLSLRQGSYNPLKHVVIARNVATPTQGAGRSLLYWKGWRLWRYRGGIYKQLLGGNEPPSQYSESYYPVVEYQNNSDSVSHLAVSFVESAFGQRRILSGLVSLPVGNVEDDALNRIELPASPQFWSNEALAWIDAKQLLVREFRLDALDRVQYSKLILLSPTADSQIKGTAGRKPLTTLTSNHLELSAAVFKNKVAFQVLDDVTKQFRIGERNLSGKNIAVKWLPIPKGSRPKQYDSIFNQRLSLLNWSSDGRYLAVSADNIGIMVWDSISQQWMVRGRSVVYAKINEGNPSNLVWLDKDRVLSFSPSANGSSFLLSGRMSEFKRSMTQVGELKGLYIRQLFNIDAPDDVSIFSEKKLNSANDSEESTNIMSRPTGLPESLRSTTPVPLSP